MKASVIDTNVLAIANERGTHITSDCLLNCTQELQAVREGIVVIDGSFLILKEYQNHISSSGQFPGDAFFRWLNINLYTPAVERIALTLRPVAEGETHNPNDFVEFPQDPALEHFDWSDRKFVAVACKSQSSPEILHATDEKSWVKHHADLLRHGIRVRNLC